MKITEIEIITRDLAGTEKFYNGVLGLAIAEKKKSSLSFNAGHSRLTFRTTDVGAPVYHFAFDISHNKLNDAEKWLITKAPPIKFQGENIIDFKNWDAKSLYFYDNNGNVVEFIARFCIDNKSERNFDGSGILSISEIAFVTNDVGKLAAALINDYGLAYFPKQIQRSDFSVIGEDDGLLILVSSERNWFPTPVRAEKFPIKAFIETVNQPIAIDYR